MRFPIAPNNPPLTAREVLHLLFGEPHAGGGRHGVALWTQRRILNADDKRESVIFIRCACGKTWRVDDAMCRERETELHIVEEALVSAPTAASWGEL